MAFIPVIYQLIELLLDEDSCALIESKLMQVFFAGFFLFFFAMGIYLAEKLLRSLTLYLVCSAFCVFSGTAFMDYIFQRLIRLPYSRAASYACMIWLLLFMLDAASMRFSDNEKARARREQDPSWTGDNYLLPGPNLKLIFLFLLFHLLSLFTKSSSLQYLALTGAVLYFLLVFSYTVISRRRDYLELRSDIRRVPGERIRQLSSYYLAALLLISLVFAAGAYFMGAGQLYLSWNPKLPSSDDAFIEAMRAQAQMEQLQRLQMAGFEGREVPAWLVYALRIVEDLAVFFALSLLAVWIFKVIMEAFRAFRRREMGPVSDEIESLSGDEISILKSLFGRERKKMGAEEMRIRRIYKRTIKKHRKELPEPNESPAEIEALAGLEDTEENRKLHSDYERARYGSYIGTD
jgi:hypothetical protein